MYTFSEFENYSSLKKSSSYCCYYLLRRLFDFSFEDRIAEIDIVFCLII